MVLKLVTMAVLAANCLKIYFIISMVDVQRLSPCGRVGLKRVRKIWLLSLLQDEEIV